MKRDALGLPPPAQPKQAEKPSKAKAASTKEVSKKSSSGSEKKENKPVPKTLPEALKLVIIIPTYSFFKNTLFININKYLNIFFTD